MPKEIRIKLRKFSLHKIGSGSFVDIYQGFRKRGDVENGLLLKILDPRYYENKIVIERFRKEFEVLKELNSRDSFFPKNPVMGKLGGATYLAYDYIAGNTLVSLLKRRDADVFDINFCCDVMQKLLVALEVLHNRKHGIVHSDISPENILLQDRRLYLIDMGCSQHLVDGHLAEKWVGKPSYLSPEQARGDSWDHKSDLYQAGIIFYEILTGERWNRGKSQKEKIVFASYPGNTNYSKIPTRLRPVLRAMLKVNHVQRIESATLCLQRLKFARAAF